MNKVIKAVMIGAMLTSVAACGAVPWNKQMYAGLEQWSVEYKDGIIEKVHYINGKELGSSTIKIQLADGTILNFSGNDILAFRGQELRAEVEKAVAEKMGEAAPEVVDAIITAVTGKPS